MPNPTGQINQAWRDRAIRAAVRLLQTEAIAACTTTAIAETAALTPGQLSEAFADPEEIIELALRCFAEQFLDEVSDGAARASDPLAALWAASETYLRLALSHRSRLPICGFAEPTRPGREGRENPALEVHVRAEAFFSNLMTATGVPRGAALGAAWIAALDGFVTRYDAAPRPIATMLETLSAAFALPFATVVG